MSPKNAGRSSERFGATYSSDTARAEVQSHIRFTAEEPDAAAGLSVDGQPLRAGAPNTPSLWHNSGTWSGGMTSGTGAFAHDDQAAVSEADALFAVLDQTPIGDGLDRWTATVLQIHADERNWWIDVATAPDNSVNV